MEKDAIISALIGLAGACSNNPKTTDTDPLVIRALAFPLLCPEADDQALTNLIDEIHTEKYTISPGCAQCTAPCGNTSDYDMARLYEAEDAVRKVKLDLIEILTKLAALEYKRQQEGAEPAAERDFFYKALSYISFDIEEKPLLDLLDEAKHVMALASAPLHDIKG